MSPKPVALVTGGTRGIGLGIARHLATAGFSLALNGRRELNDVSSAIAELQAIGGANVSYFRSDIADVRTHAEMLKEIKSGFGQLDVLVNNAGVAPQARSDLLEATPESFDRVMGINLRGPYFLTQAVARWMIEQEKTNPGFRGRIINISSISAEAASINRGEYCISKAGIAMASRLWAARLAEFGIDVYEVRPGIIATDMTAGVREKYDARIAAGIIPDERWGTPDDVGRAVAMLARGELSYATGQILTIDGGLSIPRL